MKKEMRCPFCGGKPSIEAYDDGNGGIHSYVRCNDCGSRGQEVSSNIWDWKAIKKRAWEKWLRRPEGFRCPFCGEKVDKPEGFGRSTCPDCGAVYCNTVWTKI